MCTINFCLYLFVLTSLFGCAASQHHFYAPDEGILLALEEQKDLKISAGSSTLTAQSHSMSLQAGYSPINHLGLQSSLYYQYGQTHGRYSYIDGSIRNVGSVKNAMLSGAIGVYHKIELMHNRSALLDLYGGYTKGANRNIFQNGSNSRLGFGKTFLQGGAFVQDTTMGVHITFKKGILDFEKALANGQLIDRHLDGLQNIIANDSYKFTEVAIRATHKVNNLNLFITFNLKFSNFV